MNGYVHAYTECEGFKIAHFFLFQLSVSLRKSISLKRLNLHMLAAYDSVYSTGSRMHGHMLKLLTLPATGMT